MSDVDKTKPFTITKEQVWRAYNKVRRKGEGTGVDNQTWEAFDAKLSRHLYKLWNRMTSGSYLPPPVRMVEIPKASGGTRPLGIPTVSDRVAQAVVAAELEAVLEPVFHEDSYGYRPSRSAHHALAKARQRCWRYDWVVDVDIKSFFDTLDHGLLMKALRHHIKTRWVLLYAERWLGAQVVLPDGRVEERRAGVPQGGVISPLLANLYLHYTFDLWMRREHANCPFERYADDIVIHCHSEETAERIKHELMERFQQCGLTAHPEKTKIVYCKDGTRRLHYERRSFTFLGYDFQARRSAKQGGRPFSNFTPGIAKKAVKRLCAVVRSWRLHHWVSADLAQVASRINPVVRGWIQYYGKFRLYDMDKMFQTLNLRLVRWARKKHKRFRYNGELARAWVKEQTRLAPELFAHWQAGFVIV
jgi:group II intron reverse transcriptase/maturase